MLGVYFSFVLCVLPETGSVRLLFTVVDGTGALLLQREAGPSWGEPGIRKLISVYSGLTLAGS